MFFHHNKDEKKDVPVKEIQKMSRKGMSDKDIIKHLKSRGYNYEQIEKAMLHAVKAGVGDHEPPPRPRQPQQPQQSGQQDLFSSPQSDAMTGSDFNQPAEDVFGQETMEMELPEDVEDTDAILEELIEGVIEDKWSKFDERAEKLEDKFSHIQAKLKQVSEKSGDQHEKSAPKEYEMRINEVNEQLEDLEARVGGLEKAFKQFLPSLTRNIESLSEMIHEMKRKDVVQQDVNP